MKTIIIPTDFSPAATNAVHYGIDMAQTINASLLLLHVYTVPVIMPDIPASMTDVPMVMVPVEEMKQSAEDRLAKLKNEIEHIATDKLKVYTEARLGNTIDELEELCNKTNPFAVIMGTRGDSGVERALFGSTTLNAIRHLVWPVICLPPGKQFGSGIKKIGFACDFREEIKTIPAFIKEFVKEFHAELHVLNVDYNHQPVEPGPPEQSLQPLFEELKPEYHIIQQKDVEEGINEFAEKNNLDLLITIPKKHKLLEGIFGHHRNRELAFHSHIPVMCVHG